MQRGTLLDFFDDLAVTPGAFLVYDDGLRSRTFTYGQVAQAARAFAARLHAAGLRAGDRAIVYAESRPEWIAAFWGCLLAGVVVVPIDPHSSIDFVSRVGGIVSAKVLITDHDLPASQSAMPLWLLHTLDWPERADWTPVAATPDDVAEIIFTSGATAEPKGVVITHRNVLADIVPIEREIRKYRTWAKLVAPIRFLNLLPLSHMFGQALATFIPAMLPGVVVFMRGRNPADVVAQIRKHRVSVLVSVPKMLEVVQEYVIRLEPEARSPGPAGAGIVRRWFHYRSIHNAFGWKFWAFIVGAAPLDPALEAFWRERSFAVIQGYGLTETAPIVTINHPFSGRRGSVGKAIPGVEIRLADDGEILVKGDNVSQAYVGADAGASRAIEDGWLHTGDMGEFGPDGQLFIRGRKKEMIATPEGLKVFPEDIERVLNSLPGVRESAVVGTSDAGAERPQAVLVVDSGVDLDSVVRDANRQLEDHQKIRRALVWPDPHLPRTEGTQKLKRGAVRDWANSGVRPRAAASEDRGVGSLIASYAGRPGISAATTIDELGLSSLERVELMMALEDRFDTRIDEAAFAEARDVATLQKLVDAGGSQSPSEPVAFPWWNRSWPARALRRISLPMWILPIAQLFARVRVDGLDNLKRIDGPVIFASNHQSHMDTPVILAALPPRYRYRIAPAMAKEFFVAHFFPERASRAEWLTSSLNYGLAALFFNAFPIPQREIGARHTLRYIGALIDDGHSILIFPEGSRTETGEIHSFKPGVGMIASRLGVPVVPVRLEGVDRVLHRSWRMAKRGMVRVAFGQPLTLEGDDFAELARQVETRVRNL